MMENKDDELKRIQRKMLLLSIADTPGAILLGLGLFGLIGADGDAFIDILNNRDIALAMTIVGGAILAWTLVQILALIKRKAELNRQPPGQGFE